MGHLAGGGYAVNATMSDHRVKAVGIVSGLDIGAAWRRGWYGTGLDSDAVQALEAAARQRTAEAQGAGAAFSPYVGPRAPRTPTRRTST